MKLEHGFTVPASVEDTWAALNDLQRVVPCFPGASLTAVEGADFKGACKVKLGPISLVYTGSGRFVERDESAHRAVLEAKGRDKRGNGTASAKVVAQLASAGPGSTTVDVETDLSITGKPAQFGRGVMQDVSDKLLAQFVECLKTTLGEPEPSPPTRPAPPTPPAEPAPPTPPADIAPSAGPAPPADIAPSAGRSEEALDLGSTVLPVLARRYGPYLAGVIGILVLLLVVRRLLRR
jgi:carbon monoxide dehydrogenase subunit G